MNRYLWGGAAVAVVAVAAIGAYVTLNGSLLASGSGGEAVSITIADSIQVPAADAKATAIVAAANDFLATLDATQRKATVYAFDDNTQRALWSNLPKGLVERGGLPRAEMSAEQIAALDKLLAEVLSANGVRNVNLQLAAEDMLESSGSLIFGSEWYYVSFLGEPSTNAPWMLQFGGHHLAMNMTFAGSDTSFSPMLTGGQPLKISYEGSDVFIPQQELEAAQAFMASLDDTQRAAAIKGSAPIDLLAGPGEFGTSIAAEGVAGSALSADQQSLLLAVIEARLGFANADDFEAKMQTIRAEIAETSFGWWGPTDTLGAAYFRVTGPSIVMEYAPQDMGGDLTDHAHNMFRDPTNDYGSAWISAQ